MESTMDIGKQRKDILSSKNQNQRSSTNVSNDLMSVYAIQLHNETGEKKETIMDEAIKCIFVKLPQAIINLDLLLKQLQQLTAQYSNYLSKNSNGLNYKFLDLLATDPKYKFIFEAAKVKFPPPTPISSSTLAPNYSVPPLQIKNCKQLLESCCANHLLPDGDKHTCFHSYHFPNDLNLFPWGRVIVNEQINKLFIELRSIFLELSQLFLDIQLGFSLMFPRSEDNEQHNLSLDVLNKLLSLASLDYPGKNNNF